jgi:lipopolysaccharide export system protein LptC
MTHAATTVDAVAPPARHREQARALRHTRRVRLLRVVVPVAGTLLVAVLVTAAALPKLLPLSALSGVSLTADGLVMNEPRLSGHLGEGRRYEVVAARAVQSLVDPSRLSLEGLDANLEMDTGERVSIFGSHAAYDTETEILKLSDGVTIASSDGNEARLSAATVFLREGRVESDGGIEITSPRGHIRAGRIDITGGGDLIRFAGGVSITIHPAP